MIESVQQNRGQIEPIFNFLSQTVGWLEDGIAFSNEGRSVAFINGGDVFAAQNGHYLGTFDDGLFRERLGCIVACTRRACRSTVLPSQVNMVPNGAWIPPSIQSRLVPGRTHSADAPPLSAKPLLNRSSLDWNRFVTGCEAQWPWDTRL